MIFFVSSFMILLSVLIIEFLIFRRVFTLFAGNGLENGVSVREVRPVHLERKETSQSLFVVLDSGRRGLLALAQDAVAEYALRPLRREV